MSLCFKFAAALICALPVLSCSGKIPSGLGLSDNLLAPCPSSPNCVSSNATDDGHKVEAFVLSASPEVAWGVIREEAAALPRTTITEETPDYLHVQCASALFGFVDDFELHLRQSTGTVDIRSASRVGYSDLGVNRRRVERLRQALQARGVIR